jgi:nitroreductase
MNERLTKAAGDVFDAAQTRRSIRGYLKDPVPPDVLREIVAVARWAPSGSNIQPWRVHVLTGAALTRLSDALVQEFLSGRPEKRDYKYYTEPIEEPYLARRRQCGWGLYTTLDIKRGDYEKSRAYRRRNYEFFGAPAGLVFSIDAKLERGSWLDYGMFVQTIMLAARAKGLHTCPEASISNYPDIVRAQLGIGTDLVVICGMALGYADPSDGINSYQPARIGLDDYATFLD